MLAAAFPRQSWRAESEAVYVMALASQDIDAVTARAAVAKLVLEETELPPVALVVRRCREMTASEALATARCPQCGSQLVAVVDGNVNLCFDCDWQAGREWESE